MKLPQSSEFEREFADGSLICREGERSEEMFVIQAGGVRIFKTTTRGELELARLTRGDFFGEMSVLESLPRDASAQALGDTRVLVMTAGALLVRLRRDPTFAFELLRRLSGRVRGLNARLVEATGGEAKPSHPSMLFYAHGSEVDATGDSSPTK
jgi:CRP/FNR family transcriptional regulator, cyclic AMP receptor protein